MLFDPATQARFEWARWATLRTRLTMVFSYHVSRERSQYQIGTGENKVERITAYSGEVFVDAQPPHAVTRLTSKAEEIPVDFPVQRAETILDYKYVDLSGESFLLPYNGEVLMDGPGRDVEKRQPVRLLSQVRSRLVHHLRYPQRLYAAARFQPEGNSRRSTAKTPRTRTPRLARSSKSGAKIRIYVLSIPGLFARGSQSLAMGQNNRMSVEKLVAFIQSSEKIIKEEKTMTDKQLADFLSKVKLTEKLEPRVIEDLEALDLGPLTRRALEKLRVDSQTLTASSQ
jgi:hypothetical protein